MIDFYEKHQRDRGNFEILSIHLKGQVETLEQLDEKIKPFISTLWKGRTLPFPILLDSTGKTEENYHVRSFPTHLFITPTGTLIKVTGDPLKILEDELNALRANPSSRAR